MSNELNRYPFYPSYDKPYYVTNTTCSHCGMFHPGQTCPRIKAIEYFPNGMIKRIEFKEI